MVASRSNAHEPLDWVKNRLSSWGYWLKMDKEGRGFGASCLTIEEARSMPVRAFVATNEHECEQTHRAVLKLPLDMRKVAMGFYVDQAPARDVARRVKVSERQAYYMQNTLLVLVRYCLENQHVKTPPVAMLLKSVQ